MPDCKETSAQVPLYNEIQATTTFASLALFFFFVFTEITGSDRKPSPRADDAGPRPSTTWQPRPMRTPLPGMGDSSAPRSVIGMICNIISARS